MRSPQSSVAAAGGRSLSTKSYTKHVFMNESTEKDFFCVHYLSSITECSRRGGARARPQTHPQRGQHTHGHGSGCHGGGSRSLRRRENANFPPNARHSRPLSLAYIQETNVSPKDATFPKTWLQCKAIKASHDPRAAQTL